MPPAAAPLGAQPPIAPFAPGDAVWQWLPLNPSHVVFDHSQQATGVWWPAFVIKVGTAQPGQAATQLSVRHSGVRLQDVVPREVKKRKATEAGTEPGPEDEPESDNAQEPAAKRPKKSKTEIPIEIAVARILVLTNDKDDSAARAALLSPMDPLGDAQLFIAGVDRALPHNTGAFHEIAFSYAAGAGKKPPRIDLRAMHGTVAKSLGVTPDNLFCAIAIDQTADVAWDMEFAELPNVQVICPHLVRTMGGPYAAPKIPAFALSPAYQTILARMGKASGSASPASSPASSASSPAKSPAAPPASAQPAAKLPEQVDLTGGDDTEDEE